MPAISLVLALRPIPTLGALALCREAHETCREKAGGSTSGSADETSMIHLQHRSLRLTRLVALLSLSGIVPSACGLCRNEEMKRIASSDGTLEAVVFQRDCGATTDFSTQISVVRVHTNLPSRAGNAYVADRDRGRAPAAKWGGPPASVRWLDARTLEVRYDPNSRVFFKAASVSVRTGWFQSETVFVRFTTDGAPR
jgi:hypothetical protein